MSPDGCKALPDRRREVGERPSRFLFLAAAVLACLAGPARTAGGQGLAEFTIPTAKSYPTFICAGPDGTLWFTEGTANKIGRVTTAGEFTEFAIPTTDSLPLGITAGPDGNLWFVESGADQIGRITTKGVIAEFPIPGPNHGPTTIATGPDGSLWFTESLPQIGRMTTAGVITEFPIPSGDFAGHITEGPDGALWFDEQGPNLRASLGRITTAGSVTEFPVPSPNVFIQGIASGPDGALWFTESFNQFATGRVGRMTTNGSYTEFPIPPVSGLLLPQSFPGTITAGPDAALWFREVGGVGRIDAAGTITQFLGPNSSQVSGQSGIAAGPDGSLWFTEIQPNAIGRLGSASCPLSPALLCLSNLRFQVKADFTNADGANGSAKARFLTPQSGYLWFQSRSNPEIMVKVLDGCSSNDHYWLFVAGLTDFQVEVEVKDLRSGQLQIYSNPPATRFAPIQDTRAFPCQ